MVQLNRKPRAKRAVLWNTPRTHEGAPAATDLTIEQQLRRSVCSCLLWEDTFYESGKEIADRIAELAGKAQPAFVAGLAVEARQKFNLRHVPLLLVAILAKTGSGSRLVSDTIVKIVQRADELTEFLAVYAKMNGVAPTTVKKKLSAQVKLGLARAFENFDQYQLAKYNRDGVIKMRDVAFLAHAKPANENRGRLMANLVNTDFYPTATKASGFPVLDRYALEGKPHLDAPETWEVQLSAGREKKQTFQELLQEGKLGYLALLRNLRGMMESGVDRDLVREAILARKGAQRVLPFRYIQAARACPQLEPALDQALIASIEAMRALPGKTIVLVDVSGSMDAAMSQRASKGRAAAAAAGHYKSDLPELNRIDAAATLAAIIPGMDVRVFTFSNRTVEVPARKGMAGVDAIKRSQPHSGTLLGEAVSKVNTMPHDRLIVITDEQSHDFVPAPRARNAYLINVAPYRNGVGYDEGWVHLDGFSEHVLRFIAEYEQENAK